MRRLLLLALFSCMAACGRPQHPDGQAGDVAAVAFDSAAWRTADSDSRGEMCPSLMASHSLVGMPLNEVVALLGPPDSSNHYVWYWVGAPDPEVGPTGRFKIYFRDGMASSFDADGLPEPRPNPVPFERARWLGASAEDRFAMLQDALALEAEYLGGPRADVEDFFGPPSFRSHEVEYALSPAETGFWVVYRQRLLTLQVDPDGRVSEAVDHVVSD